MENDTPNSVAVELECSSYPIDHSHSVEGIAGADNKACVDDEDDDDTNDKDDDRFITKFYVFRNKIVESCAEYHQISRIVGCITALCLYLAYVAYVLYLHHGESTVTGLKVITSILFFVLIIKGVSRYDPIDKFSNLLGKHPAFVRHSKRIVYLACGVLTCVTIITEVILVRPENLISLSGIAAILIIFFVTSTHPHKISWRPVLLGLFLQYVFALTILRLPGVRDMFIWCGEVVKLTVRFSKAGGQFLFGSLYLNEGFVFHLIPLIAFIIAILSILEHLGVLHALLRILGRFLAFCTGASPAESLNASANIFMGPIDSLMVIRPYLKYVTPSELHCMMANGMSTVTGSVIGLYISFGISAGIIYWLLLLCQTPVALAVAKLAVPE
ncbi:hypothetical protein Btru_042780 [Bulinus truncatus]|nr:hypothetical protein Btru_042780 [Bulinus truncatus]